MHIDGASSSSSAGNFAPTSITREDIISQLKRKGLINQTDTFDTLSTQAQQFTDGTVQQQQAKLDRAGVKERMKQFKKCKYKYNVSYKYRIHQKDSEDHQYKTVKTVIH